MKKAAAEATAFSPHWLLFEASYSFGAGMAGRAAAFCFI